MTVDASQSGDRVSTCARGCVLPPAPDAMRISPRGAFLGHPQFILFVCSGTIGCKHCRGGRSRGRATDGTLMPERVTGVLLELLNLLAMINDCLVPYGSLIASPVHCSCGESHGAPRPLNTEDLCIACLTTMLDGECNSDAVPSYFDLAGHLRYHCTTLVDLPLITSSQVLFGRHRMAITSQTLVSDILLHL